MADGSGALRPLADRDRAAPETRQPPARRHVTLNELLFWVYGLQKAHRYLRREYDWFLWQTEQQGIEQAPQDRRPVHPDAALVHMAVMEEVRGFRRRLRMAAGVYGQARDALQLELNAANERAGLIVHFAELGERPERFTEIPRPYPTTPNRRFDDWAWAEIDGERVDYVMLIDCFVTLEEEEWVTSRAGTERRGRAKLVKVPVKYCPARVAAGEPELRRGARPHRRDLGSGDRRAGEEAFAGAEFRSHVLVEGWR